MATERLFMRVSEAAERLGCDPRTVSRGIEKGVIPATVIGRLVRIPVRGFAEAVGIDAETLLADLAERDAAPPLAVPRRGAA